MIHQIVKTLRSKIHLTSDLIELIVRLNENAEIKLKENIAKQLEDVWDILSSNNEFIESYNKHKKELVAKRQLRKEEVKMQAIIDPQA